MIGRTSDRVRAADQVLLCPEALPRRPSADTVGSGRPAVASSVAAGNSTPRGPDQGASALHRSAATAGCSRLPSSPASRRTAAAGPNCRRSRAASWTVARIRLPRAAARTRRGQRARTVPGPPRRQPAAPADARGARGAAPRPRRSAPARPRRQRQSGRRGAVRGTGWRMLPPGPRRTSRRSARSRDRRMTRRCGSARRRRGTARSRAPRCAQRR